MLRRKQKFDGPVFFSSDFHLNHKNICRATSNWSDGGTRDFPSVEAMNDAIIGSINDNVPEDATLFFLGDFNFGDKTKTVDLRRRINCQNIVLIYGNHDEHIEDNRLYQAEFLSCQHYAEILVRKPAGGYKHVCLFHFPTKVHNKVHHGSYMLSGHSHGSLPYAEDELGLDVGWDVWRKPLSFQEIDTVLSARRYRPRDHHNETTN